MSIKKCPECNNFVRRRNKFCSSSCAAKFNNRNRSKESREKQKQSIRKTFNTKIKINWCKFCNNEFEGKPQTKGIFCSTDCHNQYRKFTTKQKIDNKEYVGPTVLKNYIIENYGYHCSNCKISNWNNEPLTLELDHIDGDPSNNISSNVRLLCPNCHSQTKTFKGRNVSKNILKQDKRSIYHRNVYHKWRARRDSNPH